MKIKQLQQFMVTWKYSSVFKAADKQTWDRERKTAHTALSGARYVTGRR